MTIEDILRKAMERAMEEVTESHTPTPDAGLQRLRAALRDKHNEKWAPPKHLTSSVTLKSRPCTWAEREAASQIFYSDDEDEELAYYYQQRCEIAEHFWPGINAWLQTNVKDYFITSGENEGERLAPIKVLTFHFRDDEDAMLFGVRFW